MLKHFAIREKSALIVYGTIVCAKICKTNVKLIIFVGVFLFPAYKNIKFAYVFAKNNLTSNLKCILSLIY